MAENEKTTGRGVRWALIASLAVNFVVIGAVAGFVWMGPPEPQGRPAGPIRLCLTPAPCQSRSATRWERNCAAVCTATAR